MCDELLYTREQIASFYRISPAMLDRLRAAGLLSFLEVTSISNAGGGFGRAVSSYPSSLTAAVASVEAYRHHAARAGATKRWSKPATDPSSGSLG